MTEVLKNTAEELIIKKVIEYSKVNNHQIQALWFGEENSSCGGILSDINLENSVYSIKFKNKIMHIPSAEDFLILRVFFLFAPISGKVKKVNDDKSLIIDNLSFVKLKNNKRRYPRFILNDSIETQMMIGNHVFSIEINDISKDGIGFIFSSERSMLGLAGKSGFIQLNYNNILLRISGDIVWINRFSRNEYIGGMLLYTNNQDKNIITDIIFENIFKIESELFRFMSFVSCEDVI
ncbi:MAG: PilZ domain-containing protein [Deltaproteobacteria bacterium]|nr:PilZ domain-containing protein [Deltaproteobacteria bacterium]